MTPTRSPARAPIRRPLAAAATALGATLLLGGCSTVGSLFGSSDAGAPIDYRSQAVKTPPLEVPPDLTQLSREGRFAVQSGQPVSASTFGQPTAAANTAAAPGGPAVVPQSVGSVRMMREGDTRRLVSTLAPEVAYQRALAFWKDAGFSIDTERPEAGVIETAWAENRGKLPRDFIRNFLGRFADGLFSTGERDRFRTRIERTATGSDITVSHRGMIEAPVGNNKDQIAWQARPSDPDLEAEMMYRLMARLGAPEAAVQQARASDRTLAAPQGAPRASSAPARARLLPDGRLQIDDGFDRAWRAVGAGLDRGGFTVEDRDRAGGIYFVRYIDRNASGKGGLFDRVLDVFRSDESKTRLARYRIVVKEEGPGKSALSVLNSNGQPETSDTVKSIREALLKELQ